MLAAQPEVATGMREKSYERVHTRYRFEDYADKLIDVCESLLGYELRKQAAAPDSAENFPATIPMHVHPTATSYPENVQKRAAG